MPTAQITPSNPANAAPSAETIRAARTKLLLEGPIGPTLVKLAAPSVLAMLVQAVTSIAEGVFASQLGVSALARLALVFPLVMLTQMLAAGAMGGADSCGVDHCRGSGRGLGGADGRVRAGDIWPSWRRWQRVRRSV